VSNNLWQDPGFKAAAQVAVRDCLDIKPGEKVVVVTDEPLRSVGELLWQASKEAAADAVLIEIMPRNRSGEEPPAPVAAAMKEADVIFCPTSKSLSHTQARHRACEAGARVATLPNIRQETLLRAMSADYAAIARRSKAVADIMTKGSKVRLTTPAGTDLVMSLEGRAGHPDTGDCREPGSFSNLPAGEAFIAPVEGSTEGMLVIDGTMGPENRVDVPVRMKVEAGFVVSIEGGESAQRVREIADRVGKMALAIAELGVGTNEKAEVCGSVLEDEKVMGTVHVAIGDNSTFGGTNRVPSHQDGIMLMPTLIIDDKVVVQDGVLVVEG
jgi:leucyl aminopeptidase (aminopeptidase T)